MRLPVLGAQLYIWYVGSLLTPSEMRSLHASAMDSSSLICYSEWIIALWVSEWIYQMVGGC